MDATTNAAARVSLDRNLMGRGAIFALFLLWPLLLFGRPAYIPDSMGYLKGGQAAVTFALSKVTSDPAPPTSPVAQSGGVATASAEDGKGPPKANRSIVYSILAYVLRLPGWDMTALAVFQILLTAMVCAAVATVLGVRRWWHIAAVAAALAFATPLAVYTSAGEPDVFAALAVVCLILFITAFDRVSTGTRLALAALVALSVSVHASIPPLALGMILVGSGWLIVQSWRGRGSSIPPILWMIVPVTLAMAMMSVLNLVAFGTGDLAGKRYPLALARSVSDGPARWYLERECKVPKKFAVCEVFGTHIPTTVSGFVFDDTGLNGRATAEQMDRIRAEESQIVWRAALAYPGTEVGNLVSNIVRQTVDFGFQGVQFNERVILNDLALPELVPSGHNSEPLLNALRRTSQGLILASLLLLGMSWQRIEGRVRLALGLLVPALFGNAFIVVVFSGIAQRYGARVIWLVPLFALSAVLGRTRNPA